MIFLSFYQGDCYVDGDQHRPDFTDAGGEAEASDGLTIVGNETSGGAIPTMVCIDAKTIVFDRIGFGFCK